MLSPGRGSRTLMQAYPDTPAACAEQARHRFPAWLRPDPQPEGSSMGLSSMFTCFKELLGSYNNGNVQQPLRRRSRFSKARAQLSIRFTCTGEVVGHPLRLK